jgi:hypothetical protein
VSAAVGTSSGLSAQLAADGSTGVTTASQTVSLNPGTYTVQPLAAAANGLTSGSFSVVVSGPGNFNWQDAWSVSAASAPTPAGESILSKTFTVTDAGNYTLTLTDQNFPASLQQIQLIILPQTANPTPIGPFSTSAPIGALPTGTYDLFVIAQANAGTPAGLYSVQIVGGSTGNSVAFADTEPVGALGPAIPVTISGPDNVTLQVSDLAYPAALAPLQAMATQGANVLASGLSPAPFAATKGTVQVYVFAQPGASGQGAFAVYATDAAGVLADIATPVFDSTHSGYAYVPHSALSAVAYQLTLNDYQTPQPFAGLTSALVQHGAVVPNSTVSAAGVTANFTPQAGPASILVFPTLGVSGNNSLFAVTLVQFSGSIVAFNTTQGVGALFSSNMVHIPSAGTYEVQATDLGFPMPLSSFDIIVTQGQSVVKTLYAGGQALLTVNASGDYVVNVLAQVGGGAHYGLYGLDLSQAVPPTVTLTASPTSVSSGGSTLLTWSSNGATSCTASGGWNGSQPTSGSTQTAAQSVATTYTLTCNGVGGSGNASVTVTIQASSKSSGGGGGWNLLDLTLLSLFASLTVCRRQLER